MPYVPIAHQNSPLYSAMAEGILEALTDQVYSQPHHCHAT
jgi:hypothetical protein